MLVESAVMKLAFVAMADKKEVLVESAVTSAVFVDSDPASELTKFVFASSPFITFVSLKNKRALSDFRAFLQNHEVVGMTFINVPVLFVWCV